MQFLSVLLILASSTSIVLGAPTSDSGVEARAILGFGKSASTKVNECFQKCGLKYSKCMAEKNPNMLKCQRIEATCQKPCADMAVKQDGKARMARHEARAILGFGKSASTKVNECFQKCGLKYSKCMAEKNPNMLKCQRIEATCQKPCADMAVKQDGKARMPRREVVAARAPVLGFGKSTSTKVNECFQKCGLKYSKCMAEKNPNMLKCQRIEATCQKPCADMAVKQDGKARGRRDVEEQEEDDE